MVEHRVAEVTPATRQAHGLREDSRYASTLHNARVSFQRNKSGRFYTLSALRFKDAIYAYQAVSKLVPKSKYQNFYNSMSSENLRDGSLYLPAA
jgi:hypothetical protein